MEYHISCTFTSIQHRRYKITHHSVFAEIRLDIYKSPSGVNQITSTVWPETHERRQLKSSMSMVHNNAKPDKILDSMLGL